jgi:hypothetical protein
MKSFELGVNRVLEITENEILIKDTKSSAEAVFPKVRWATFLTLIDDVDEEVTKLKEDNGEFRYSQHYGGGWQIPVTSGIRCVDLRRFFLNAKNETKPTRQGIGLRLPEWETLKDVIKRTRDEIDGVHCHQHENVVEWFDCRECFPFRKE